MGKRIIFKNRNRNFIFYQNKKYIYDQHSGRIESYCKIEDLLNDETLLKEMILNGFDCYEKEYLGYKKRFFPNGDYVLDSIYKNFYIPISKNFIEFYQLNWANDNWNKEYITLSNTHLNGKNVESFYEFSILVEIEGIRICGVDNFGDKICFSFPDDDEIVKNKMVKLFGEPQVHPQNKDDKYGQFAKNYFFISRTQMDKIIGIKKYRDTSTIGQPDGEQFTGEEEEIVLDLHNFDENIYKIFEEHGMLKIEGLE